MVSTSNILIPNQGSRILWNIDGPNGIQTIPSRISDQFSGISTLVNRETNNQFPIQAPTVLTHPRDQSDTSINTTKKLIRDFVTKLGPIDQSKAKFFFSHLLRTDTYYQNQNKFKGIQYRTDREISIQHDKIDDIVTLVLDRLQAINAWNGESELEQLFKYLIKEIKSNKLNEQQELNYSKLLYHAPSYIYNFNWDLFTDDFLSLLEHPNLKVRAFSEELLKNRIDKLNSVQEANIIFCLEKNHRLSGDLAQLIFSKRPDLQEIYSINNEVDFSELDVEDILTNSQEYINAALNQVYLLTQNHAENVGIEIEMKLSGTNQFRSIDDKIFRDLLRYAEFCELDEDDAEDVAEIRTLDHGFNLNYTSFLKLLKIGQLIQKNPDLIYFQSNHIHVNPNRNLRDLCDSILGFDEEVAHSYGDGQTTTWELKSTSMYDRARVLPVNRRKISSAEEIEYCYDTTSLIDQIQIANFFTGIYYQDIDFENIFSKDEMSFLLEDYELSENYYEKKDRFKAKLFTHLAKASSREDLIPGILRLYHKSLLPEINPEFLTKIKRKSFPINNGILIDALHMLLVEESEPQAVINYVKGKDSNLYQAINYPYNDSELTYRLIRLMKKNTLTNKLVEIFTSNKFKYMTEEIGEENNNNINHKLRYQLYNNDLKLENIPLDDKLIDLFQGLKPWGYIQITLFEHILKSHATNPKIIGFLKRLKDKQFLKALENKTPQNANQHQAHTLFNYSFFTNNEIDHRVRAIVLRGLRRVPADLIKRILRSNSAAKALKLEFANKLKKDKLKLTDNDDLILLNQYMRSQSPLDQLIAKALIKSLERCDLIHLKPFLEDKAISMSSKIALTREACNAFQYSESNFEYALELAAKDESKNLAIEIFKKMGDTPNAIILEQIDENELDPRCLRILVNNFRSNYGSSNLMKLIEKNEHHELVVNGLINKTLIGKKDLATVRELISNQDIPQSTKDKLAIAIGLTIFKDDHANQHFISLNSLSYKDLVQQLTSIDPNDLKCPYDFYSIRDRYHLAELETCLATNL